MRRITPIAATLLCLALVSTGCMRTVRARGTQFSDFLDDYSTLTRGERYDALYHWRDPGADWARYDRLILEPVVFWGDARTDRRLTERRKREIATYFYNKAYVALSPEFLMLDEPHHPSATEPDTLELRIAITRIDRRDTLFDTTSTITTLGLATTSAVGAYTGRAPYTGELAIEFMIHDAETGRTLARGADRRVGGKWLLKGFDPWADAYAAIDAVTDNLAYRLCALRGESDCDPPLQP